MFSHAFSQLIRKEIRITIVAGCVLLPLASFAQGRKSSAPPPQAPSAQAPSSASGDEKLDVSDLEKKYWASKDSDFSVVQNRLYSKAKRFSFSGTYGSMINDPWTTGSTYGFNLGYYFSERWGVELAISKTATQDNQAVQRLKNQAGYPDHNQIKDFMGVQALFVPFYAKMSAMDWAIIYFDMSFALGLGMQKYAQMQEEGDSSITTPAITFDITQNFFISRNLSLRFEFKNRWYSDETMKYRSTYANNPSRGNGSSISNASFLLFGLAFLF